MFLSTTFIWKYCISLYWFTSYDVRKLTILSLEYLLKCLSINNMVYTWWCSPHRVKLIQEFLKTRIWEKWIKIVRWPPKSPVLTPLVIFSRKLLRIGPSNTLKKPLTFRAKIRSDCDNLPRDIPIMRNHGKIVMAEDGRMIDNWSCWNREIINNVIAF